MTDKLIGIILLAAGESARLGEPKQLLHLNGENLLRRSLRSAIEVSEFVVVVLGARFGSLQKEIKDLPVYIAENPNWKTGMSSSIKVGLETLFQTGKSFEGILIMVCDQPFVDSNVLQQIIDKFQTINSLIVASEYEQTIGVPALFQRTLFPDLLTLDEQSGARKLIKKYRKQTSVVNFPLGAFDIDTPFDYAKLLEEFKH